MTNIALNKDTNMLEYDQMRKNSSHDFLRLDKDTILYLVGNAYKVYQRSANPDDVYVQLNTEDFNTPQKDDVKSFTVSRFVDGALDATCEVSVRVMNNVGDYASIGTIPDSTFQSKKDLNEPMIVQNAGNDLLPIAGEIFEGNWIDYKLTGNDAGLLKIHHKDEWTFRAVG